MNQSSKKNYRCALSNGERVELTIYPELQEAIDCHWDSLFFPYNEETFATAIVGEKVYQLVTTGEISIYDNKEECEIEIVKESIRLLINDGGFAESLVNSEGYCIERYDILDSNLFQILSGSITTGEKFDQTNFFDTPNNQFQFIKMFLESIESLHHY